MTQTTIITETHTYNVPLVLRWC